MAIVGQKMPRFALLTPPKALFATLVVVKADSSSAVGGLRMTGYVGREVR